MRSYVDKYQTGGIAGLTTMNYQARASFLSADQQDQLKHEVEQDIYLTTQVLMGAASHNMIIDVPYLRKLFFFHKKGISVSTTITSRRPNRITIQLEIELTGSLFEQETSILEACNDAGRLAAKEALLSCDADGHSLNVNGYKYTSRTQSSKQYHTAVWLY